MNKKQIFSEIDLLYNELIELKPISKENQDRLNRKFRLEFQYNTNHLEGNTLTYAETELLLIFDETRGSHTLREHEEMKGSDVAFELVKDLASDRERPLTEAFIKNLNQILLVRPYWKDAITEDGQKTKRKIIVGDYKKNPNSVLLENGEIFQYASPMETPQLMGELLEWFNEELSRGELNPLELAARLHHRFVLIHPFDDGNGRISRLLLNYVLFHFDLPPIIIKSDDKSNYLRSLRDADTGDIDSFISYLGTQLLWSMQMLLRAAKNESIDELDDWKKNLKILKRELDGSDEIKLRKSDDVIHELINEQILPFGLKIGEELSDFSDLFLSSNVYYNSPKTFRFSFLTASIDEGEVESNFMDGITLHFYFNEFKKKINNPFRIIQIVTFYFDDFKYKIVFQGKELFFNLYHQKITEKQIKELTSAIASSILNQIEEQLK